MGNEVYIELVTQQTVDGGSTPSKYRVDLAPINGIEDTYTKSPEIESTEVYPEEGEDPQTIVYDTKLTLHRFIVTGVLTLNDGDVTNGVTRLDPVQTQPEGLQDPLSKVGRLRILYGYGKLTDTQVKLYKNGTWYFGWVTRITLNQAGGENFYDYIIEVIEATQYDP